MIFEKSPYPRHKVCGEYVSREIMPYLNTLGINLSGAKKIDTLQFTSQNGHSTYSPLPLGGLGISRYALDNELYLKAVERGVEFVFESIVEIQFQDEIFIVSSDEGRVENAKVVIGAYGKRSQLDKQMARPFIAKKTAWLAVKAHYHLPEFPQDLVALHNFEGGYAGLSMTESNAVNLCYLASYNNFSNYKDIGQFNEAVLCKNPNLREFFDKAEPLWDKPLSIAQISFDKKEAVANHIVFCGDTAGLIHPLCGNGMAMAIHSAKMASELIESYLENSQFSRTQMEQAYAKNWKKHFSYRMAMGRKLQSLLLNGMIPDSLLFGLAKSPWIMKKIISKTHGKPIAV